MIKVSIKYNGKDYDSIEKASADAAADGLREMIEKQIEPFRNKVKNEKGSLEIQVNYSGLEDLSAKLIASDISDDLIKEIQDAIN